MRVVICDDNPIERKNLLEITTHISKSDGLDTEFEVFESAKQMLFEVEDKLELIDVMFLDINMPGIDGMEAASKLRSNGYSPQFQRIICWELLMSEPSTIL